ncbi:death-associated inhibitor of apoptosis 1 [Biomphalaria pfeifferi]|uniref:Death-associated inhibitor of apoptosis 1 n=1 Tax=Biomphalaria pfeifferi TaxID=112525 RepID=A0AAD8BYY8_BIOPF|nr:death-associated inhibitor of apoptosis 1 [Biomphalaria pfeifferi]
MNCEIHRLRTFLHCPSDFLQSPSLLASDGFLYAGDGNNDAVICFFCKKVQINWPQGADIQDVHFFMSPDCPMVTGQPCENIAWPARPVQEKDIALAYYSSMGINLKALKPRKIVLLAHDK